MKNVLIFCFFLLMISCGKDDNPDGNNTNNGSSYISMKINGVAWKGETNFVSGLFQNNFSAQATFKVGDKSQVVGLSFENINLTGVNVMDKNSSGSFLFLDNVNNISWGLGNGSSGSGQFKITKSKAAQGITQASATFSGTTKDIDGKIITVTDGVIYNALAE